MFSAIRSSAISRASTRVWTALFHFIPQLGLIKTLHLGFFKHTFAFFRPREACPHRSSRKGPGGEEDQE